MSSSIAALNVQRLQTNAGNDVLHQERFTCFKSKPAVGARRSALDADVAANRRERGIPADAATFGKRRFPPSLWNFSALPDKSRRIEVGVAGKSYSCSLNLHYL